MRITELPDVVLETVLSNLTFDQISRNRIVCRRFDRVCKTLLNRGFNGAEKFHSKCARAVKSQLPRRESERRRHPLSRHCDILAAIETRISMLSMTYSKYMDLNLCCFIPGKVIDELFRLLRLTRTMSTPPRAHEILQELRDLSSMAMEHFDEKILPEFKQKICSSIESNIASRYELTPTAMSSSSRCYISARLATNATRINCVKLDRLLKQVFVRMRRSELEASVTKTRLLKVKQILMKQDAQIKKQNKKILEQQRKLQSQEQQMSDMKRQFEEFEQKLGDLTTKACKEENAAVKGRAYLDREAKRRNVAAKEELQVKKRKLIVERQVPTNPKDAKFKEFLTNLLRNDSDDV